jgi:hypothetical protein
MTNIADMQLKPIITRTLR